MKKNFREYDGTIVVSVIDIITIIITVVVVVVVVVVIINSSLAPFVLP